MILQPQGSTAEFEVLGRTLAAIEARLAGGDWAALHRSMTDAMAATDFWTRSDRQATLSRYALMDRARAAAGTARSLQERLARGTGSAGRCSRQLVSRLALQLYLCELGLADALSDAPLEVVVCVQPAMESGGDVTASQTWCQQVSVMFENWARKRHMKYSAIADGNSSAAPYRVVSGFGAWTTLSAEAGMHVLESDAAPGKPGRAVARVRVAPLPLTLPASRSSDARTLAGILDQSAPVSSVVRRYRLDPSPLVRDAKAGWRSGRVQAVLDGDFDLIGRTAT
jgi:ATP-dependent Clp protease ATP-binding subunit ClpC